MLRIFALFFGLSFMIFGVLGFMPEFTYEDKLLGIFTSGTLNNFLHIILGAAGLTCGLRGTGASRAFFIIVGILFGVLALLGFYDATLAIFRFMATSSVNNWLYTAVAIVFLYLGLGFFHKKG